MERFLERADVEHAVLDERVVRLAGVVLQFVVAPAADPLVRLVVVEPVADVEVPLGPVDRLAVELVAPDQFPAVRRGLGRVIRRAEGDAEHRADDQCAKAPSGDPDHTVVLRFQAKRDQSAGGNKPTAMRALRTRTRSGAFMLSTAIVALPVCVLPTRRGPSHRKCRFHFWRRGWNKGTMAAPMRPARFGPFARLHLWQLQARLDG